MTGIGKTLNSESTLTKLSSSDQLGKGSGISPHFNSLTNAHESVPGPVLSVMGMGGNDIGPY